jgi:ubiquinone/menaquinone biosynthesis C-methylase UbiE
MMERIPEPDLMDDAQQAKAYADADFSEPHNVFVNYFRSRFPDFSAGSVLDLGCGTADVIIRFAKNYPRAIITGIDGAEAMLDIARHDIERRGFADRIELKKCLLPDPGLYTQKFDAVISNSLLHHLADPKVLWETLKKCAKNGAPVLIMDLLRPDSVKSASDFMLKYGADESPLLQKDFYNSLLASYNIREIGHQLKTMRLDFLNIEIVSDRHVLVWGQMKISNG